MKAATMFIATLSTMFIASSAQAQILVRLYEAQVGSAIKSAAVQTPVGRDISVKIIAKNTGSLRIIDDLGNEGPCISSVTPEMLVSALLTVPVDQRIMFYALSYFDPDCQDTDWASLPSNEGLAGDLSPVPLLFSAEP